jgi:hypothetical protein
VTPIVRLLRSNSLRPEGGFHRGGHVVHCNFNSHRDDSIRDHDDWDTLGLKPYPGERKSVLSRGKYEPCLPARVGRRAVHLGANDESLDHPHRLLHSDDDGAGIGLLRFERCGREEREEQGEGKPGQHAGETNPHAV